jgi:hypothetical protein
MRGGDAAVLHVVQRGLIAMKYRMLCMVERNPGFVIGSDRVFRAAMRPGLCVMSPRGDVVFGGDDVMFGSIKIHGERHRRRCWLVRRTREITWQWAAFLLCVTCARRLPVFLRAKCMAMSRYGLMCGVSIILANLVVPRRFAMKIRSLFMMYRGGYMMVYRIVGGGHDHSSLRIACWPRGYQFSDYRFSHGKYLCQGGLRRDGQDGTPESRSMPAIMVAQTITTK